MSEAVTGADFGAMTDQESSATYGGDGPFSNAAGWFVGYAYTCTMQAIAINANASRGQASMYIEGYGWF
ncbi:MAG: hypothetical protein JWM95_330 [Gemmatimonadetes bacterium]|nr:hypothetical protein [Gemmatimonadota bacterium]